MPGGPSQHRLLQVARKTLSRDENDKSPIADHYLHVLFRHLQKYPDEDKFLMDLQDGGRTLVCLFCMTEVFVANDEDQLVSFDTFWDHIASTGHQALASEAIRATCFDAIGSHMNMDHTSASAPPSSPTLARNITHRRRVLKTVQLSDGDFFEYSTDEDDTAGPPSYPSVGNILAHTPLNSQESPLNTQSHYASPSNNSSSDMYQCNSSRTPMPSSATSGYNTSHIASHSSPTIASSSYQLPSNISSNTGSLLNDAGPGSFSVSQGRLSSFPIHPRPLPGKRVRRGVRRLVFPDGDTIYLSTDDEDVDDRPEVAPGKKPRLGGALIKTGNDIQIDRTAPNSSLNVPGAFPAVGNSTFNPPSSLSGSWSPQIGCNPQWPPSSSNVGSYLGPDPAAVAQADMDFSWEDHLGLGMPGAFGGNPYPPPAAPAPLEARAAGYVQRPNAGSFNLNYDEEGPMDRIDVGGPDQNQKLRDFFVSAMEDFQETPKVVDAAHKLGLENTAALLPGLEVQLMPHQLIGVSWMIEQEAKPNLRGGILADDMGLGKTIQCIATCAKNRPEEGTERKSTLVVAPAALLEQWAAEFRQRTQNGLFFVHIHHGKEKLRSTKEVQQYDVVITTYQTLCADFPKDKKDKEKDGDDTMEDAPGLLGPLAATLWHRVVLDEAQCIRNRVTRTSRCVARLDSTYRWVLTGTPVTNTLADLYALVRFLRFRPFNDWKEFNERIARVQRKRPDLAGQRAQALLKKCLLRRTKDTKLEGKLILQLPPKQIEVVEIDFSPDERDIYNKVEKRQQQKMSKFLKAGTVMKKYAVVLVMLLRLRQVCNHPQLITLDDYDEDGHRVIEDDEGPMQMDTSPAGELERAERLLGCEFVMQAKAKLLEQVQARIQAEAQGTGVEEEDTDCPICFDTYVNNCRMTSCRHLFCGDCLNDLFKSPPNGLDVQDAAYAQAMQSGTRSCPVCRGDIHPEKVFKVSAFEPTMEELNALRNELNGPELVDMTLEDDTPIPVDEKGKGKGKATVKDEEDLDGLDLASLDRGDNFDPSAKMLKMTEFIKEWMTTAPDDKIICYSQWTSMITLVETLLHRDNIETIRFDGKMSRLSRDIAISRFKKRSGPSIMLISLKCGGVGLNLVEANRVLCLDLAWNAATENQAFDRVHRMGQQKDVHVKRLIIRNTVEERILNLQSTKQSLADAALGEGKAQKIKKMSVNELKTVRYDNSHFSDAI
ncbi:SNF2 family N-terminal domain-containing protein [Gautieria morchelliformis]|nr:SNF2 family N-terminal domain-containing protein [Gautieria morchelliformis]